MLGMWDQSERANQVTSSLGVAGYSGVMAIGLQKREKLSKKPIGKR